MSFCNAFLLENWRSAHLRLAGETSLLFTLESSYTTCNEHNSGIRTVVIGSINKVNEKVALHVQVTSDRHNVTTIVTTWTLDIYLIQFTADELELSVARIVTWLMTWFMTVSTVNNDAISLECLSVPKAASNPSLLWFVCKMAQVPISFLYLYCVFYVSRKSESLPS